MKGLSAQKFLYEMLYQSTNFALPVSTCHGSYKRASGTAKLIEQWDFTKSPAV